MKFALLIFVIIVVFVAIYIRVAPHSVDRWHRIAPQPESRNLPGGAIVVLEGVGPDTLAQIDARAMATPRTTRLAGSVEDGLITYMTRSRIMGFPDYTTLRLTGDRLEAHARLRFGRKDFGVNRARLRQWLQQP